MNYYDVLGLQVDCSPKILQKHIQFSEGIHPILEEMKNVHEIREAYDVLKDPTKEHSLICT